MEVPSSDGSGIAARYDGKQIRDTYIHPGLEQQSRGLAPVVRLMIEEVLHERGKALSRREAGSVGVREVPREVLEGELARPADDEVVEPLAVDAKFSQVCRKRLAQ